MSYKRAGLERGNIVIQFQYNKALVEAIKVLPGKRWDIKRQVWFADLIPETIDKLASLGFEIDPALPAWFEDVPIEYPSIDVPTFQKALFPFQKEGVGFLEMMGGSGLIADDMGLGKTAQSLAFHELHPEFRPAVIIVPASVKYNWVREIENGLSSEPHIYVASGRTPVDLRGSGYDFIVINYDIVQAWLKQLRQYGLKAAIIDEAHKIANPAALRSKAVIKVCRRLPSVIALSGTPVMNRPVEFFSILNLIKPDIFHNKWGFMHRYCDPKNNGFGWEYKGASNTMELHKLLKKHAMIRRLKMDVLTQLPPKTRVVIPVDLTNRKQYLKEEKELAQWLEDNKGEKRFKLKAVNALEHLKQLVVEGKMKPCIEWIEDALEDGGKLIVFATHTKTLDDLQAHFKLVSEGGCCVRIDGSTPQNDRLGIVDTFQTNPICTLFIGNMQAAGEGITLTASSRVAFLELGWTPSLHAQAEDRAHRIGQYDNVTVYYLIANGTLEEHIVRVLDEKQKVISEVLDGKTPVGSQSILGELLKEYLNIELAEAS